MTTTNKSFNSLSDVLTYTSNIFNAYAVINDNSYISSDGEIHNKGMARIAQECWEYSHYCDWSYIFGIRTRGVEGGERAEYVRERIVDLHDTALAGIKVNYDGKGNYFVTFKRR